MGGVARFSEEAAKRSKAGPPPERLALHDLERLFRLAAGDYRSLQECEYAWSRVCAWHAGHPGKRDRVDWVMVVVNAMREGWGLAGFRDWWVRRDAQKGNTRGAQYPGVSLRSPKTREVVLQAIQKRREEVED